METCYRICSHWPKSGIEVEIHTSLSAHADPARILAPVVPKQLPAWAKSRLSSRVGVASRLHRMAEQKGIERVRSGDICYCWPGTSTKAIAAAKAKGGIILLEFINTHVAYARKLLDDEHARLGIGPYPAISDADILHENERLRLADLVFAPGPFVGESIRSFAPAGATVLETSYGAYLPADERVTRNPGPLRFVFVGTAGIRKGVHILLQAWEKANLPAELLLAGGVESSIREQVGRISGGPVRFLGFQHDISAVYRNADVFVFPSLEEGGPQVTYEAAAHGLPLIVTGMGGGRIARDGHTALVVPPCDPSALANALTLMFRDEPLRLRLGTAALHEARNFDWSVVAMHRLALLDRTLGHSNLPIVEHSR